jgi:hypothetical protein
MFFRTYKKRSMLHTILKKQNGGVISYIQHSYKKLVLRSVRIGGFSNWGRMNSGFLALNKSKKAGVVQTQSLQIRCLRIRWHMNRVIIWQGQYLYAKTTGFT